MKKKMITVTVVLLTLAGVLVIGNLIRSYQRRYQPLEVGGFDYVSDADHEEETALKMDVYEKTFAVSSKQITMHDVVYQTTYDKSQKGYYYHQDVDIYRAEGEDFSADFAVNADTGRIDRFFLASKSYDKSKEVLTRDACLALAQEYLGEFTVALDYTLVGEEYREIPEYTAVYEFEFARMIGGMKTSDAAYVGITVYGDVISHVFNSLEEMKGVKSPSAEVIATVNKNVDAKMKTIYSAISNQYRYSYEVEDIILAKMENGKLALLYEVDVTLEPVGEGKSFSEFTQFLIYLE